MIRSVSFIGSGNVATHMARALYKNQIEIRSIASRRLRSAKQLAAPLKSKAVKGLSSIDRKSDLYIIAVPDDSIEKLAKSLLNHLGPKKRVVHTSGATPTSILEDRFHKAACVWPLQSLSKDKRIDFRQVPICLKANNKSFQKELKVLFNSIASSVYLISDEQKQALHLASVIANNFSNHMFTLAQTICVNHDLDFDMLHPLILETANKIIDHEPIAMQTGPAIRDDKKTMKLHLKLLGENKEYTKLYKELSKSISRHKP